MTSKSTRAKNNKNARKRRALRQKKAMQKRGDEFHSTVSANGRYSKPKPDLEKISYIRGQIVRKLLAESPDPVQKRIVDMERYQMEMRPLVTHEPEKSFRGSQSLCDIQKKFPNPVRTRAREMEIYQKKTRKLVKWFAATDQIKPTMSQGQSLIDIQKAFPNMVGNRVAQMEGRTINVAGTGLLDKGVEPKRVASPKHVGLPPRIDSGHSDPSITDSEDFGKQAVMVVCQLEPRPVQKKHKIPLVKRFRKTCQKVFQTCVLGLNTIVHGVK